MSGHGREGTGGHEPRVIHRWVLARVTSMHPGSDSDAEQRGWLGCGSPLFATARQRYCPTTLIMSKIGRYIDTIIPPTTTPRKTMSSGSIAASSASTAVSTSSS